MPRQRGVGYGLTRAATVGAARLQIYPPALDAAVTRIGGRWSAVMKAALPYCDTSAVAVSPQCRFARWMEYLRRPSNPPCCLWF
eukprot:scaffold74581_cov14-Prasinocladus_malaysianus.AAC.1